MTGIWAWWFRREGTWKDGFDFGQEMISPLWVTCRRWHQKKPDPQINHEWKSVRQPSWCWGQLRAQQAISCCGHLANLYGLINCMNALNHSIRSAPVICQTQGLSSPGPMEAWDAVVGSRRERIRTLLAFKKLMWRPMRWINMIKMIRRDEQKKQKEEESSRAEVTNWCIYNGLLRVVKS